jgi:hypothetical protein
MSLLADALDDDVSRHALADLRSARRKNRIQQLDAFDAFYKAYVTALFSAIGVYAAAGAFGDTLLTASEQHTVRVDGPGWIGLLVAFAIAIGLRSGGRGGPLAFERADVRHVLLAPVDRRLTIRRPAMRQLRYMVFLGASFGAAAGVVAMRRMPERPVEWIATGALFGIAMVLIAFGAAMVAGGYRARPWMTDFFALAVLGWSMADIGFSLHTSPMTFIGESLVWPLSFRPTAFLGLSVAVGVAFWGLGLVNRSSIEAAERRSRLVGQLRFAATLQDVRTVMVLQRQLAQEHMRQHPWIRLRPRKSAGVKRGRVQRRVFVRRGIQGMLRWPLMRLVRLFVFAGVAAACVAGIWAGTGPLIVVAGLAMWMAALDLCEPLAQEIDHPDRTKSMASSRGVILVSHVFLPFVALLVLGVVASLPIIIFGNTDIVVAFWPLYILVAASSLGGASLTVNAQPPSSSMVDTPETASIKFIWRVLVPPAIAVAGFLPLIPAHKSWAAHHDLQLMVQDSNMAVAVAIAVSVISLMWLRYADDFRAAMATTAKPTTDKSDTAKKTEDSATKSTAKLSDKPAVSKSKAKKSNKKKGRK